MAIAFLHAYINPADELAAREAVLRVAPNMRISISSEVVPELREFERTSTTIVNVYVQGRTEEYLRELQQRLARVGFGGVFRLMLSAGGIATPETAMRFPVRLLESGPAAGALAAAHHGAAAGVSDLLSFDLGGTTAKFAVIIDGEPLTASEFEVDRRYRFKKGSGLPVKIGVIEMIEIGAGGGSIARVDSLGLLRVGPDSAGATPGPSATASAAPSRRSPTPTSCSATSTRRTSSAVAWSSTWRARGGRSPTASRRRSGSRSRRPRGASTRASTSRWPTPRACTCWSAGAIRAACRCSCSAAPGRCTASGSRAPSARRR